MKPVKALCNVQKTLRFGSVWLHNTRFTVDRDRVAIARHAAISRFLVPGPVSQYAVPLKLLKAHVCTQSTVHVNLLEFTVLTVLDLGDFSHVPILKIENQRRLVTVSLQSKWNCSCRVRLKTRSTPRKNCSAGWGAGESMGMRNAKTEWAKRLLCFFGVKAKCP